MTGLNRREFAESVMTAALVPLLGVAPLSAGWWQGVSPTLAAVPPDGDLDALAGALAAVVRSQYGERLTEADVTIITRQIRAALDRAEQMRKVHLANGDEPDFAFSAPGDGPR